MTIAKKFGKSVKTLQSKTREQDIVKIRAVICYVLRVTYGATYKRIARELGYSSQGSAKYHKEQMENLINTKRPLDLFELELVQAIKESK